MENNTVYTGNDISNSHLEALSPISIPDLYSWIKNDQDLKIEIDRIRKVKLIDKTVYENVKKRLPFFCCSTFTNGFRKSENFVSTWHFILDIDKVDTAIKLDEIRKNLLQDTRIKMMFISPGGNGLKLIFELSSECKSLKQYSDFYKSFSYAFAQFHKIEAFIDYSTSDATRVCFLSADPDVIINPFNETVNYNDFLPAQLNFSSSEIHNESETKEETLTEDIYKSVLSKLGSGEKQYKKEKQIFVPEILNTIAAPLIKLALEMRISVKEIRDIHYGKKVVFVFGNTFAEINIFFGAKGFSVVKTPKNGSDQKLADACDLLVRTCLSCVFNNSVQQNLSTLVSNPN